MTHPAQYVLPPAARLLLADLGLSAGNILKRADLPGDLFSRARVSLPGDEYFRLWQAIADEAQDPRIPLRIGTGIPVEGFDAPLFAALCSPNLNTALARFALYKRLMAPMALHVDATAQGTRLTLEWLDKTLAPPAVLVLMELVFFVEFARIATRSQVRPLAVRSPHLPQAAAAFSEFFGVKVTSAETPSLLFAAADATRPFLTVNEQMWRDFEPGLKQRLSELDHTARASERVRSALLELLPAGAASMEAVCKKLGTSVRTLQRRLNEEGETFQTILNRTREALARHYLKRPELTATEISFLLGYEDPSSFFRAFTAWTGTTPEHARATVLTSVPAEPDTRP
jgi:AraC-like DNA-binding protein